MEGHMPTEEATQASSQGNPPRLTTSSLNTMTTATPVTNDANRVFTLFPKLPLELRLKIWKHTLPGPRVVPICTWDVRLEGIRAVSKQYASLNSSINITSVCHEARALVMETYDQFPSVPWQVEYATDHDQDAFAYVDYNIDTVFVGDQVEAEGIPEHFLGKIQHLAWRGDEIQLLRDFTRLDLLQSAYPRLKSLTFVASWQPFAHGYGQESRFIEVPAGLGPAMTLPQLAPAGIYDEEHAEVVENHGNIAFQCALARETVRYFEEHGNQAEWKNISLKMAIHAGRETGSYHWILTYWVHDDREIGHWHEEPILVGDGALTSCRPDLHPDLLCFGCSRQRWLQSNDAFWLSKDEGQGGNRIGGQHDSSAGSAEDVTDEEPENDTEEVAYNASEEFYDNIEVSFGDLNV